MQNRDWFESWFDSPYYHILYQRRDHSEAEKFIENLLTYLNPPGLSRVLDLACGKGRHSQVLARSGLDVFGADLSPASIESAKELESGNLHFFVHDMRSPLQAPLYNYVFNLFTSFGYFEDRIDNLRVVQAVANGLSDNGFFIIDFLNAEKSINNLIPEEALILDEVFFRIKRSFNGRQIVKEISFEDKGEKFLFEEKVQALTLEDFETLLTDHFKTEAVFGNYDLAPFDNEESDRLILVLKKIR